MSPYVIRVATEIVLPIAPLALHVIAEQSDTAQVVITEPMHIRRGTRAPVDGCSLDAEQ